MTVNMHEAKTQLSALVERVLRGDRVTIARAGTPVVDLIPHRGRGIRFGTFPGDTKLEPGALDAADDEVKRMFYGDDE